MTTTNLNNGDKTFVLFERFLKISYYCHCPGAQCVGVGSWELAEFSWLESQGEVKNVMRRGSIPMFWDALLAALEDISEITRDTLVVKV